MTERRYDSLGIADIRKPTDLYDHHIRVHNYTYDTEYTVSRIRSTSEWRCGCMYFVNSSDGNCKHITFARNWLDTIEGRKAVEFWRRNNKIDALRTLKRIGLDAHPHSTISKGKAIGFGVFSALLSEQPEATTEECFAVIVDAAIEMLTQRNGLSAACLEAIGKGKGKVTRRGRRVYITLPENWRNF